MDLYTLSARARWLDLPQRAGELAESLLPLAIKLAALPADYTAVWYSPENNRAYVEPPSVSMDTLGKVGQALDCPVVLVEPDRDPTAVRIASGTLARLPYKAAAAQEALFEYLASTGLLEASEGLMKLATNMHGYSPVLRGLGEAAGYLPGGNLSWQMPGMPDMPRHLQGAIGGGLIGAGLGYGAGWLGSQLLPDSWDKSKLKRNAMLAGAGLGMLPAGTALLANYGLGRSLGDDGVFQSPPPDKWVQEMKTGGLKEANSSLCVTVDPLLKRASQTGIDEALSQPLALDPDAFSHLIWNDDDISSRLSIPQRAAASGLVQAALMSRQQQTGDSTRLIYPSDIGRVALGMGSGYVSGAIVGKVLGELVGLPDNVQDRLKTTGMWAGVVANVLPLIFGR